MSAVSIIFKENDLMHVSTTTLSCQKTIWTGSWDTKNECRDTSIGPCKDFWSARKDEKRCILVAKAFVTTDKM